MAVNTVHIESIDRLKDETFLVNFSDDTIAVVMEPELLELFAKRRTHVVD